MRLLSSPTGRSIELADIARAQAIIKIPFPNMCDFRIKVGEDLIVTEVLKPKSASETPKPIPSAWYWRRWAICVTSCLTAGGPCVTAVISNSLSPRDVGTQVCNRTMA